MTTTVDRAAQVLTREWYRMADEQVKASPERHCRRLAQALADDGVLPDRDLSDTPPPKED